MMFLVHLIPVYFLAAERTHRTSSISNCLAYGDILNFISVFARLIATLTRRCVLDAQQHHSTPYTSPINLKILLLVLCQCKLQRGAKVRYTGAESTGKSCSKIILQRPLQTCIVCKSIDLQ
jgi:hypothetical protein